MSTTHSHGVSRRQLVSLFVVGLLLIGLSQWFKTVTDVGWLEIAGHLILEILRDLGIAFCISVVVALVIELSLATDTFISGLDAIMNRTVPPAVWEDFRQHVITQPIMRKDWHVKMTIKPQGDGKWISETELAYVVLGLQRDPSVKIGHDLDVHRTPNGCSHRFKKAKFGQVEYVGTSLDAIVSDMCSIEFPDTLINCNEEIPVEAKFVELISCPDTIVWWMARTTENVFLTINSLPEEWSVAVRSFHPSGKDLEPTGENNWKFTGIMFPGQGLEVRIKAISNPT
jgi:hypothetical protein